MKIGDRIRELRKEERLKQREFAARIMVSPSYVSFLEKKWSDPSERLILNICQAFSVNYQWLKEGKGEKYNKGPFASKIEAVLKVIEDIYRKIESDRSIRLHDLASILIDPENPVYTMELPRVFYLALFMLIRIFNGGDPWEIESIMAQLRAFMPNWKRKRDPKRPDLDSRVEVDRREFNELLFIYKMSSEEALEHWRKEFEIFLEEREKRRREDGHESTEK